MSASQYKSGENTEIYFHIDASCIQLIYLYCGCFMSAYCLFLTSLFNPVCLEGLSLAICSTFCKTITTR